MPFGSGQLQGEAVREIRLAGAIEIEGGPHGADRLETEVPAGRRQGEFEARARRASEDFPDGDPIFKTFMD